MRAVSWAVMFLVSCSISGTRTLPAPAPTHPTVITFHTDVDFTKRERGLLEKARRAIWDQTGHHVLVQYVYDLDYSTSEGRPPLDQWYLSRSDSDSLPDQFRGSLMLGLTFPTKKQTVLVYDRLGSDNQFQHTAMHEFLHALDTPHLPCQDEDNPMLNPEWCHHWPRGLVMAPRATWDDGQDAPLCMNKADADAVARVTQQPRADFRPCL